MSSQEYNDFGPENEEIMELSPEIDESNLPVPTAAELDVIRRRDLVVQATDALGELFDRHVSVPDLLRAAKSDQPATFARLQAKRALRCIQDIGEEDSRVVATVGEGELYHYVEGVMQYGASKNTYLGLMQLGLSAEDTTGLYALRELINEETDGVAFPELLEAIKSVGLTIEEAIQNPDVAAAAFMDAGYFVNYSGSRIFAQTVFSTGKIAKANELGFHRDNLRSDVEEVDPTYWARQYVENTGLTTDEENIN